MEKDDRRRLTIARAILPVRQAASENYGSPDMFAILLAIGVGHAEGSPLDVSSVAALASTSRQTVLRAVEKCGNEARLRYVAREGGPC
jgi:hypothetical protein